jgi:hypothetical protein
LQPFDRQCILVPFGFLCSDFVSASCVSYHQQGNQAQWDFIRITVSSVQCETSLTQDRVMSFHEKKPARVAGWFWGWLGFGLVVNERGFGLLPCVEG